jgi:hypothetical protein
MAGTSEKKVKFNEYTFRAVKESDRAIYTAKLLNYYDPPIEKWKAQDAQMSAAKFRGALLRLFGKPYRSSSLSDEAFEYIIEVSDSDKNSWILTAYEGATGSAIGGNPYDKGNVHSLVKLLRELIDKTAPADFDAVIYDEDTNNTVEYGYKNGEYYYREFRGKRIS